MLRPSFSPKTRNWHRFEMVRLSMYPDPVPDIGVGLIAVSIYDRPNTVWLH